jgi:hypothetical protein
MLHRLVSPRNVVALTAAILLCYLGVWLGYDHHHRIDNDFISTYLGSWLLRGGHRTDLYDPGVQRWAHDLLVGPTPPAETFMPFVNVPIASLIAMPVTLLGAASAYMAWSTIQLALLGAAVAIAYRSAPRPAGRSTIETVGIVLLVLSAYVTLDLPLAGQWDGLNALGVAMAYRSWRRDGFAAGGAWLVATMALAKPHLAIGLLAFIVGWGNRRAIAGAVGAGLTVAVASFALVGMTGAQGWVHLLGSDAHAWSVRGQSSFVALAGGWTGDGPLTFPIAYAGTVVLAGLCFVLGRRLRRGRLLLGPALAAAACLSLLASPHSFVYDTIMLAPAITWLLAEHSPFALDRIARTRAWVMVLLWHGATSTRFLNQIISPTLLRIGTPVVWIEVGLAAYLWKTAHASRSEAAPAHRLTLSAAEALVPLR